MEDQEIQRPGWYDQVVEQSEALVKAQPVGRLITQNQERIQNEQKLRTLLPEVPMLARKWGPSCTEQWQGLYPEVEQIIFLGLRLGLTREKAAALTGNSGKKFNQWMGMGARGFSPFQNFSLMVMQVESLLELEALGKVEEAAALEMKSAGTYLRLLERRHPVNAVAPEMEDDLPFHLFTDTELQEYTASKGKVVPIRFTADIPEERIDPLEHRRLLTEFENLQRQLQEQERDESISDSENEIQESGPSGSAHEGAQGSSGARSTRSKSGKSVSTSRSRQRKK